MTKTAARRMLLPIGLAVVFCVQDIKNKTDMMREIAKKSSDHRELAESEAVTWAAVAAAATAVISNKSVSVAANSTSNNSMSINSNSSNSTTNKSLVPERFLTCDDMGGLEIIREVGKGIHRVTFEVALPSGERALVKRCIPSHDRRTHRKRNQKCLESIIKESSFLEQLYRDYGDQAIRYYGKCIQSDKKGRLPRKTDDKIESSNFRRGNTLIMELGAPIMAYYNEGIHNRTGMVPTIAYTNVKLSESDVKDLDTIAYQYAHLSTGPLLLGLPYQSPVDNHFPQQYVRFKAGLRHADFGFVVQKRKISKGLAMNINRCVAVYRMAGIKYWDQSWNTTDSGEGEDYDCLKAAESMK